MKITKLIFASLALLGSAAIACAQSAPPVPDIEVDPRAPAVGTGGGAARPGSRAVQSFAVKLGWNNIHAYSCNIRKSGTTYTVRLNSLSSEGTYIETAWIPYHALMAANCATGNWVSFYVTSKTGSSFKWSSLQTWSYK